MPLVVSTADCAEPRTHRGRPEAVPGWRHGTCRSDSRRFPERTDAPRPYTTSRRLLKQPH